MIVEGSKEYNDALDACLTQILDDRDRAVPFHDIRLVFASYLHVVSSLAAALIANKIYKPETIKGCVEYMLEEALTRKSEVKCTYVTGTSAIAGGKQ